MYFDPGFGSMIIQVILAILAAGGVVWLTLKKQVKALFSKKKTPTPTGQAEDQDEQS